MRKLTQEELLELKTHKESVKANNNSLYQASGASLSKKPKNRAMYQATIPKDLEMAAKALYRYNESQQRFIKSLYKGWLLYGRLSDKQLDVLHKIVKSARPQQYWK